MLSRSFLRRTLFFALLLMLTTLSLNIARADDAKPFLHPLFTSNMVLQRNVADPVWGWTTPGATVTVSISDGRAVWHPVKATAGSDGKWTAKLPLLPVGTTYTLTISGPQTVTLTNVAVGDVWICSGQSNMVFGIGAAINGPAEVAAANYPALRLFTVGNATALEPQSLLQGHWDVCTPQTVGNGGWSGFSAVGYFFGRDLQQSIHIPVGLIQTAWSGTPAESWTSQEALTQKLPEFRSALVQLDAAKSDTVPYDQKVVAWVAKNDPGTAGKWSDAAFDDSAWKPIPLPGYFQDAGIPELSNINGVVWFRKTFDLPASDAGKAAVLHLLADDNDTTWVNGTQVGATNGTTPVRAYPVAASLLKPTGNVVAVRVVDTGGKGGVNGDPANLGLEMPGGANVPLAGPWRYKLGFTLAQFPMPQNITGNANFPTTLFNGMISPLIPFGVKGAIWYQGESNAGNAKQYQTLLPTMITDWRTRFGVGPFPFMIVQLAGYGQTHDQPVDTGWSQLREAQLLTSERLPNTGLAVAHDIGDPTDIHPKNKEEVGRRLALAAEGIAYGQKIEYSGPIYQSMTIEAGSVRLKFIHVGGGLVAKGGDKLTGFSIAGADGKYVWADAKIDGPAIVVSSPTVTAPTAVRYAWDDTPVANLYNQADLPASSFRTDLPKPAPVVAVPKNAGPNLAFGQPVVASEPNVYGWAIGLTDGSWAADTANCWASGPSATFPKTVTIDLQKPAPVGLVRLGVPPFGSTKTIQVAVSTDGTTFTDVGSYVFSLNKEEMHSLTFSPKPARFVRLTYPDHYDAAVNYPNTFVFTTECEVYAPTRK